VTGQNFSENHGVSNHRRSVFWVIFVGTAFTMLFVRVMFTLEAHLLFLVYTWTVAATIISRYVFFSIYKPTLLEYDEYQPTVTVIVPAKNESSGIYNTAKKLSLLDYPENKLSVILIDDGSEDDTGVWIEKAERDFGFNTLHLDENVGKRVAISRAMEFNKSEITVFVDSDSFLDKNALIEGLRGFSDSKIAAVCGHTDVENTDDSWLTKMQTQQYFIAFKTFKSLESYYDSVTCCSGCFSMYRTNAITPLIHEWTDRKFLGKYRTFGDDRGLTNLLLKNGNNTVYLPEAKATTIVPSDFLGYSRQQLRWRRSYLMESISGSAHMWKRPFGAALIFYMTLFLTFMAPIIVTYFVLIGPIISGFNPFIYLAGIALILMLHQTFYWAFQPDSEKKVGYLSLLPMLPVWVIFTLFLLPWAMFTIRSTGWETR